MRIQENQHRAGQLYKQFNAWKRRHLLEKHKRRHGNWFTYFGEQVLLSEEADPAIRYLLYKQRYERPEAELMHKYVPKGAHVIELGGSLGVVSQFTRKHIGPDAIQVIVEADPELARICEVTQTAAVPNENTTVVPAALGYGGDVVRFAHGDGNAHIGHVASDGEMAKGGDFLEVPAVTLSALVKNLPQDEPAALICDIEGAELDLVKNEGKLLSQFNCWIVEFHPHVFEQRGSSQAAFFEHCQENGLEVIEIIENVAALRPADPNSAPQ